MLFFGISFLGGKGYELFSKFIQDMDYSELFGTPLTEPLLFNSNFNKFSWMWQCLHFFITELLWTLL